MGLRVIFIALFMCNFSLFSQNIIKGKIVNIDTGKVVESAVVSNSEKKSENTTTDANGNFVLEVKSLPVMLSIIKQGYFVLKVPVVSSEFPVEVNLKKKVQSNEVIVTALKRKESLKKVPVAITAIGGNFLEQVGAKDITAAASLAPNVNFSFGGTSSGSSSAAVAYIRGVGQNDFTATVDPGVGIYLDGVYLARSIGSILDLSEIKRVEILRGPQGTVFGRNSVGGAISLISKTPSNIFKGSVKLAGGSYNRIESSAAFHIPLSNTFRNSISIVQRKRDGYVERLLAGDDLGDQNLLGLRNTLLFRPSDKVKFSLMFDYTSERENSAAEEQLSAEGIFPNLYNQNVLMDPDCLTPECVQNQVSNIPFTTNETGTNKNDVDNFGVSLSSTFELSNQLSLKSITAIRDLKAKFARASDGTPYDLFETQDDYKQNQFSQEIQLIGDFNKIDVVTGLYYFNEKSETSVIASADGLSEAGVIPTFPFLIGGDTKNTSFAGFGEAVFKLGKKIRLTGGLRYTSETKGYDPFAINALGNNNVNPGYREIDFAQFTWRGIFSYDISNKFNSYASVSKGFKSGGYDVRYTSPTEDLEPTSFLPETVLTYEVGLKTYFKGTNLGLNIAAFLSNYDDIQVSTNPPNGVATRTINGAKATMSGLELEMVWTPIEKLKIRGSLGLIEAKYLELSEGSELSLEDEFIRTPKTTYGLSSSYAFDVGGNRKLTPRFDLISQNDIHFEPVNSNFVFEDGYNNINVSLNYKTANRKLSFTGGIDNLTDERYLIAGDSNGTIGYALGVYALPRNWFVSAGYNF